MTYNLISTMNHYSKSEDKNFPISKISGISEISEIIELLYDCYVMYMDWIAMGYLKHNI